MADPAKPDDAGDSGAESTFTQADVDRIVQDRLKRQAAQLNSGRPSDEELEALRTKATQFDALDEAAKDDLEKANDQIAKLKDDLTAKDAEIGQLKASTRDLSVKQAVTSEAARAQFGEKQDTPFIDPEDAYLRLDKNAVEFDDEGNPSNIGELVAKVAGDKPHLLGARQTPPPSLDGGARQPTSDNPDLTPEQDHARWLAERI